MPDVPDSCHHPRAGARHWAVHVARHHRNPHPRDHRQQDQQHHYGGTLVPQGGFEECRRTRLGSGSTFHRRINTRQCLGSPGCELASLRDIRREWRSRADSTRPVVLNRYQVVTAIYGRSSTGPTHLRPRDPPSRRREIPSLQGGAKMGLLRSWSRGGAWHASRSATACSM